MPTTAASSFQRFRSNLEITDLQQSTVSTRQRAVRDAVARRLTVVDSFVTGSYKRHTMISPLSEADVDVVVVLDPSYYQADGYTSLLDRVRRVLLETYTTTPRISRNGQAVTIKFTDFEVDVVPAFNRRGGGYLIPNTKEARFISTNPKVHETFSSNANQSHSGDLVPLIKMIKAWNRECGRPFRSFYLELLVEKALRGVRITNDWSGARFVLDRGRDLIRYTITDPAGLDQGGVHGFASCPNVSSAVSRFDRGFAGAAAAEEWLRRDRIADAVSEWRKLFGDAFPAYG